MKKKPSRHFAKALGLLTVLSFASQPAFAAKDFTQFSQSAKQAFATDFTSFTEARQNGQSAMAKSCSQMRSSIETHGKSMAKWAISGQTDLCKAIDGLGDASKKSSSCTSLNKAIKTFDSLNLVGSTESNAFIYSFIEFTASLEMVKKDHCS